MKTCSRLHDIDRQGVTTNENEWQQLTKTDISSDNKWKQMIGGKTEWF